MKELAGDNRISDINFIEDKKGNLLKETEDKLCRWKEYNEELFKDHTSTIGMTSPAETGPPITRTEVEKAINKLKNRKAAGPD